MLISKPPAPEVAARVFDFVGKVAKPFVVCLLGLREAKLPKNAKLARTLTQAAEFALHKTLPAEKPALARSKPGFVRGLFCGGTLCAESEMIFREAGLRTGTDAHRFVDLGDD